MGGARRGLSLAVLLGLTLTGCSRSARLNRDCKAGEGVACATLASLYAAGVGVSRDETEARRLWQRASELLQSACDAGHAEACFSLAEMYERARGVPQDSAQSAELYQKACDGGHGKSCLWLGLGQSPLSRWADTQFDELTATGVAAAAASSGQDEAAPPRMARELVAAPRAPDRTRAADLFRRACDAGSARGCRELAELLQMGDGVPMDRVQALDLFEKGCNGGDAFACFSGGTLAGDFFGVAAEARNMRLHTLALRLEKEAPARLAKACDAGDATACRDLAAAYSGELGALGKNPRAKVKAGELYQRACDLGDAPSCYEIAVGDGVGSDGPQSLARVCDMSYWKACRSLGERYSAGSDGVAQDMSKALALFQKACDGNEPVSCATLALIYLEGRRVPRDLTQARQLLQKLCDAGHPKICEALRSPALAQGPPEAGAPASGVSGSPPSALVEACGEGQAQACCALAEMYSAARGGVSLDYPKAAEFFRLACTRKEPIACARLASMYLTGQGVPQDTGQARQLYRRACDTGLAQACRAVATLPR